MKYSSPKLTPRMSLFLEHAINATPFWDLCCDHGYVGIGSIKSKQFTTVHFVDQVPHIMDRLDQLIKQAPTYHQDLNYQLHLMPAEKIEIEILGTCLVAGVGGLTIKTILQQLLLRKKLKASRLLLSPQTDEQVLKDYLTDKELMFFYKLANKLDIIEGKRTRSLYILDKNEN